METLHAIAARRSIRRFQATPVPETLLKECLEAARHAPSSTNSQPWTFLVITAEETRSELAAAAYGQMHVYQAPVTVAVLGNRRAFNHRFRRALELADLGAVRLTETMRRGYEGYERKMDVEAAITANCMLAGQQLVLAATDRGLGTCWVMLFDQRRLANIMALPKHLFPVALIPIGYAAETPAPRPRYDLTEIAFRETLDTPWCVGGA